MQESSRPLRSTRFRSRQPQDTGFKHSFVSKAEYDNFEKQKRQKIDTTLFLDICYDPIKLNPGLMKSQNAMLSSSSPPQNPQDDTFSSNTSENHKRKDIQPKLEEQYANPTIETKNSPPCVKIESSIDKAKNYPELLNDNNHPQDLKSLDSEESKALKISPPETPTKLAQLKSSCDETVGESEQNKTIIPPETTTDLDNINTNLIENKTLESFVTNMQNKETENDDYYLRKGSESEKHPSNLLNDRQIFSLRRSKKPNHSHSSRSNNMSNNSIYNPEEVTNKNGQFDESQINNDVHPYNHEDDNENNDSIPEKATSNEPAKENISQEPTFSQPKQNKEDSAFNNYSSEAYKQDQPSTRPLGRRGRQRLTSTSRNGSSSQNKLRAQPPFNNGLTPTSNNISSRGRGRRRSPEQEFVPPIKDDSKHQVSSFPVFFLESNAREYNYIFRPFLDPPKLVFSPELLEKRSSQRAIEGNINRCIKDDFDMKTFIMKCNQHWKKGPNWQPFSTEFAYKLLHKAHYDPERAIFMLDDPLFNFNAICDPPTRKYDNKWRPKDRRGQHPCSPFPPMIFKGTYRQSMKAFTENSGR